MEPVEFHDDFLGAAFFVVGASQVMRLLVYKAIVRALQSAERGAHCMTGGF
jgi:hypothetical protein